MPSFGNLSATGSAPIQSRFFAPHGRLVSLGSLGIRGDRSAGMVVWVGT